MESLGFSIYSIMSSACSDSFPSSLSIWIPLISFSCLVTVARISNTMFNRSDETGHRSLFPEFSLKALSFSPLCITLAVGLSQVAFMMLIYVLRIFTSVRVFIMKGCWILPNTFLCIYWKDHFFPASIEMIMWLLFLLLLLLMWCIMLIDLHMLNQACDPGMNPTWSWHVILLVYCWVLFTNILLKIFASNFIKDIDP